MRNRDPYVRELAAAGLADVATDEDLPRFVELLDDRELQIADGTQAYLASVGDRALPLVVERVRREPETLLLETVELLGLLGNNHAIPALEAVIAQGNDSLREEATDALARIGGARGKTVVEDVKRTSSDEYEREHAARMLADWRFQSRAIRISSPDRHAV